MKRIATPTSLQKSKLHVYIIITAVALLVGTGFYFFPWINDDIGYRLFFKDYYRNGASLTAGWMWDCMEMVCNTMNSRLANILFVPLLFVPKIIEAALSTVAVWLMLWYGLKLAGRRASVTAASLWCAAVLVILPWVDHMYVFCFQLNYIWATALAAILSYMVLYGKGSTAAVVIISLLTGAWHESFSLPLFVAVSVLWLLKPSRRTALVALCLFAGLTWLYFSPGGQLYREGKFRMIGTGSLLINLYALPMLVFVVMCAWRYIRYKELSRDTLFFLINSVCGTLMLLVSVVGPRVGFWGVYTALVGIATIGIKVKLVVARFAAAGALVFTIVHLLAVDMECFEARHNYNEIIEYARHNPDEVAYADFTLYENAPLICLLKPTYSVFVQDLWNIDIMSEFYLPEGKKIKTAPRVLKHFRLEEAVPIDGDAEMYYYGGYIVGPYRGERHRLEKFMVTYLSPREVAMSCAPFTDADGVKRSWYAPANWLLEAIFNPMPKAIRLRQ